METNKFEKHIRTQLKEREINPSGNAWKKISSKLTTKSKQTKPTYKWLGVAASVMLLVGSTFFFVNAGNQLEGAPDTIVEIEIDEQPNSEQTNAPILFEKKNSQTVVTTTTNNDKQKNTDREVYKERKLRDEMDESVGNEDSEIAFINNMTPTKMAQPLEIPENIINDKVSEVIAQVGVMEKSSSVTDAEIDSLLKRAQQDILRDKIFNTDTTVDALALLTAVEDELDQSFRDQIFNSLKAGFIKVRTAVADRNN